MVSSQRASAGVTISTVSKVIWAQGLRAFAYGFTAVLLGHLLAHNGVSQLKVGLLLSFVVFGSALSSLFLMRFGDRIGRRRSYGAFYLLLAIAGLVIALHPSLIVMAIVALTGTLSTDANDNGPATSLEQTMLAEKNLKSQMPKIFGRYNGVAALFGAGGALTQGALSHVHRFATSYVGFYLLVPVGIAGVIIARSLSSEVEPTRGGAGTVLGRPLKESPARRSILHLSALFSLDAAAGGLVTTSFLAFYLTSRYHVSASTLGYLFSTFSMMNAISMFLAPIIAKKIGLVGTMVSTHVVSNVFLMTAAFCRSLAWAVVFLFLRSALSQMDVPTRQSLIVAVVPDEDRMAASAITNASRYTIRPFSPLVSGLLQHVAIGAPIAVSGALKLLYDAGVVRWASRTGHLRRTID